MTVSCQLCYSTPIHVLAGRAQNNADLKRPVQPVCDSCVLLMAAEKSKARITENVAGDIDVMEYLQQNTPLYWSRRDRIYRTIRTNYGLLPNSQPLAYAP